MRQLADFVERMMTEPQSKAGRIGPSSNGHTRSGRAIGVIGIPGDRRDEDQLEYGAIAARRVRRDHRPRGQEPPRPGAGRVGRQRDRRRPRRRGPAARRALKAEKMLDEMTAVRTALRRAAPGDLVVCCVDDAIGVYREAMAAAGHARGTTAFADPGRARGPGGLMSRSSVAGSTSTAYRAWLAEEDFSGVVHLVGRRRRGAAHDRAGPGRSGRADCRTTPGTRFGTASTTQAASPG